MNPTIDRLTALRHSFEVARDSINTANGEQRLDDHNRGLYRGLDIAIDGIDAELRIIESGQQGYDEVMRPRPQPAQAPASTFRIEVSKEELAQRERDIADGKIPF